MDLQRLDGPRGAPRLIVLHGLEGSPRSHYARGLVAQAAHRGWAADVLVFRSCGPEPNRLLRSYHSGETSDLHFVVERLIAQEPPRPILLAGISLGGNVLLKWLGELGSTPPALVRGAVAISVPFDLARSARHLERGFARVYQAYFLGSLRRKALEKWQRFPDRLDPAAIRRARTLWEFDDAVTGPVHGFADAAAYYAASSSIRFLPRITVPTLLLSALDDPFLPEQVLEEVATIARANHALHPEFVAHGGHVGFIAGRLPWRPFYYAEWRAAEFLASRVDTRVEDAAASA